MLFSHDNGSLVLILDVQSSIVRGTLVQMRAKDEKPLILYTRNAPIPYKPHARSAYLIKMAIKSIEETVEDALVHVHARHAQDKTFPHRISAVHYVLSSPWVVSQAKSLSLALPKPVTIDREYISKLIAEDRVKLVSETIEDVRVIEEKVFDVRFNGYSVPEWRKRSTDRLEASFVASVASGRMVDKFIDACRHAVRGSHVHFHSSLFLQHTSIVKVITDHAGYVLIHVHGELTDVAIVRNGTCVFFGSYPFGIYSIVRTISRENGVDAYTAESLVNMSARGHLDEAHANRETALIKGMMDRWLGEFRSLMKGSPTPDSIPAHVIISAHSHEDFFLNGFASAYPSCRPQLLAHEEIAPLVDFDPRTEKLRTTALYAAAICTLEDHPLM